MIHAARRSTRLLPVALVLAFTAFGCSTKHLPTPVAAVDTGPVPDTPAHLLQLFKWSWEHRDVPSAEQMFSDDFMFDLGGADSLLEDVSPLRRDQLEIEHHLFVSGTATHPPATRVELDYNSALLPIPDSRPGKTFPWHQEILVNVLLRVETSDANYAISGYLRFYTERADSAAIPSDLKQRGVMPRSDRWYIQRIEDGTGASAVREPGPAPRAARPLDTLPAHRQTWGALENLYR